jgi:hypothetical protein
MLTVCRKLIPVLRIIMLIRTRDQVIVSRFGSRVLSQGLISVIIVSVLTIFLDYLWHFSGQNICVSIFQQETPVTIFARN